MDYATVLDSAQERNEHIRCVVEGVKERVGWEGGIAEVANEVNVVADLGLHYTAEET